jgi:hypothetical protein
MTQSEQPRDHDLLRPGGEVTVPLPPTGDTVPLPREPIDALQAPYSSDVGVYIDGRRVTYEQESASFAVGETPVSIDQMREYDRWGQVAWANEETQCWASERFAWDAAQNIPGATKAVGGPRRTGAWIVFGVCAALLVVCGLLAAINSGQTKLSTPTSIAGSTPAQTTQTSSSSNGQPMKKIVTSSGNFVLYAPPDWAASENGKGSYRGVVVSDPNGDDIAAMYVGRDSSDGNPIAIAKQFASVIGEKYPDLSVTNAERSASGGIMFDASYTDPQKGARQFRAWAAVNSGQFLFATISAPQGQLDSQKGVLLTVLSNISVMKNSMDYTSSAPQVDLVRQQLNDGSASFVVPSDWTVKDYGSTAFSASKPGTAFGFLSGQFSALRSSMGLAQTPEPVSQFLAPHDAMMLWFNKPGALPNLQVSQVQDLSDLSQTLSSAGHGTAKCENFMFTCNSKYGPCKGFGQGMSFIIPGSPTWSYSCILVVAPANQFGSWAGTFAKMVDSYHVDQQWVADYVAAGAARLQAAQQQTTQLISRNQDDIENSINQAYQERQNSEDYVDSQWTNYIRGEEDWVSSTEDGTIYHTDAWGTKNTATGEYAQGQPYNYYNYTGQNPNTGEEMTPVDSSQIWGGGN